MRNLEYVPYYITKATSFEVIDVPVVVLFCDLINLLKHANLKVSTNKYKFHFYYVNHIFSFHGIIELFALRNGNLIVECQNRNGSKELFFQSFRFIKNTILQKPIEIEPSLWELPNEAMFVCAIDQIDNNSFNDVYKQFYQLLVIHCKYDYLSRLSAKQIFHFGLAVTNMIQSNEIDLLRWACILLTEISEHRNFLQKMMEWKSILYMQYQILPEESIFSCDLLKRIVILLNDSN